MVALKTPQSVHYIPHMEEFFRFFLCLTLFISCKMDGLLLLYTGPVNLSKQRTQSTPSLLQKCFVDHYPICFQGFGWMWAFGHFAYQSQWFCQSPQQLLKSSWCANEIRVASRLILGLSCNCGHICSKAETAKAWRWLFYLVKHMASLNRAVFS